MFKPGRPIAILACLLCPALPVPAQITIAAAASVRYAMEDLKADFGKTSAAAKAGAAPARASDTVAIKTVYGASGQLAAQIKNGAPFDVFVSADMDFADSLVRWGYASAPPHVYAYGKLVMWTTKDRDPAKGLALLADPGIAKIALADPQRAPYGREALKAIRRAPGYGQVKGKLIFGESIAQVNQYVLLGTVDIGFTAKSVVLAGDMQGKGRWAEVDSTAYSPIAQGAVLCKYGAEKHADLAARFLAYLYSPPARAILAKYGYDLP